MDLSVHINQLKEAKAELEHDLSRVIQDVINEFEKKYGITPQNINVCMLDQTVFGQNKRFIVGGVEAVLY